MSSVLENKSNYITLRLVVTGKVQGVGYRYFVQKIAQEEQVKGFVKNNDNGSVEIVVECDKNNFEKFLKRIKTEHPYAIVKNIEIFNEPIKNYSSFFIKY